MRLCCRRRKIQWFCFRSLCSFDSLSLSSLIRNAGAGGSLDNSSTKPTALGGSSSVLKITGSLLVEPELEEMSRGAKDRFSYAIPDCQILRLEDTEFVPGIGRAKERNPEFVPGFERAKERNPEEQSNRGWGFPRAGLPLKRTDVFPRKVLHNAAGEVIKQDASNARVPSSALPSASNARVPSSALPSASNARVPSSELVLRAAAKSGGADEQLPWPRNHRAWRGRLAFVLFNEPNVEEEVYDFAVVHRLENDNFIVRFLDGDRTVVLQDTTEMVHANARDVLDSGLVLQVGSCSRFAL